jgi:hypothetical protein
MGAIDDHQVVPAELDDLERHDEDEALDVPAERRRVKTEKQDLPVETLQTWVKRGKIDLQPEFQRMFVWNAVKASRLIESILLEIPIPVIYTAEEADKTYSVVDGQQRLTSICCFIDGKFPDGYEFRLSGLQVLTELNGERFRELLPGQQEAIMSAILRLIVITKDSHPDIKFEVFERLNLGAVKLNDQELRNCMYRGAYNVLLAGLADNRRLRLILGRDDPDPRMKDRQLILRFFAMWRNTHLKYRAPMKQFLNREMEQHRNPSKSELDEMRRIFDDSIEMTYTVFGKNAFRRFNLGRDGRPDGAWEERKLNVALWDTMLYTFTFFEKRQIVPIADRVREEFLNVMSSDQMFIDYITSSTDKTDRILYRAKTWRERLDVLVTVNPGEPRSFSLSLKESLHKGNPSCQICGQRIHGVDDAEIDHVEHYWRGGRTIPENARLTHRYCNRKRGGRP